ncbi:unnamed protein product [Leuciscus chuanchicus]
MLRIDNHKPEHQPPTLSHKPACPVTWATAESGVQNRPGGEGSVSSLSLSLSFSPHGSRAWQLKNTTERAVCICFCEVSTPGGWHYDKVRGHRFLGGVSRFILLKVTISPSQPSITRLSYGLARDAVGLADEEESEISLCE